MSEIRRSLEEMAASCRKALVFGNGGGGDVLQGISVANHLEALGVTEVFMGGVNCAWVDHDPDEPIPPGQLVLGPQIYALDGLSNSKRVSEHIVEVSAETRYGDRVLGEAVAAAVCKRRTIVIALQGGVPAAAAELAAFIASEGIDLVISADVGSDSFFTGKECHPAHTSLVDFMSLGILTSLDCATVFGLGGYGCDGELVLDELQRNLSIAMAAGAYIGAHGLTPRDCAQLKAAFAEFFDPIGALVIDAAEGRFGWHNVPTTSPWGHPVEVTPLAALTLFFDPHLLVEHVCTAVPQIAEAVSLEAAEDRFEELFGYMAETRLVPFADLRRPRTAS